MNIGTSEILLILVVVLLLFGGKRLPELARSIGKGLSEFRRAAQEIQHEINSPLQDAEKSQPTQEKSGQSTPRVNESSSVSAHHAAQPRTPKEESPSSS